MTKDIMRQIKVAQAIEPSLYTATKTGAELDMTGVLGVVGFSVEIGEVTTADASNYFTFTVLQAESSGGSFSEIDADQYDAVDGWDFKLNEIVITDPTKVFNVRLKAGYPYLKVVATETGTASATFGVSVLKQERHN